MRASFVSSFSCFALMNKQQVNAIVFGLLLLFVLKTKHKREKEIRKNEDCKQVSKVDFTR